MNFERQKYGYEKSNNYTYKLQIYNNSLFFYKQHNIFCKAINSIFKENEFARSGCGRFSVSKRHTISPLRPCISMNFFSGRHMEYI